MALFIVHEKLALKLLIRRKNAIYLAARAI